MEQQVIFKIFIFIIFHNPKKSRVINIGIKIFEHVDLKINDMKIDHVKELKILGFWFNECMNNNSYLVKNFANVRKSFLV